MSKIVTTATIPSGDTFEMSATTIETSGGTIISGWCELGTQLDGTLRTQSDTSEESGSTASRRRTDGTFLGRAIVLMVVGTSRSMSIARFCIITVQGATPLTATETKTVVVIQIYGVLGALT